MLINKSRLQEKMDDEGLDGIVAATLANVHYFAGFWSVALSLFPYDGQCYAIVDRDEPELPYVVSSTVEIDQVLDGGQVKGTASFGQFFREGPFLDVDLTEDEKKLQRISDVTKTKEDPFQALIYALKKMGLVNKKVGIDTLGIKPGYVEKLKHELPNTRFVECSETLRWVRKVKTTEEVHRLRRSALITGNAILAAAGIARKGVTEYEVAREFERSVVSQGAMPKFTQIRFGRNAVAGQRTPGQTPLAEGDTIWFDVGSTYRGYCSDIARVFSLGEPNPRARKVYEAMLKGEEIAIKKTRAGMLASELFNLTMEAVRADGVPEYRRHHVGHGIGSEVYEPPIIAPSNDDLIEVGCVINIETPYYEYGLGALHVEDPYLVRKDGNNELLSDLPRGLQVL
jgi:Xaa-Pro aminopeptidase